MNKCDTCNNVYSHRQSLWRHKQHCNNKRIRADTASYPDLEKREKKSRILQDVSFANSIQLGPKMIAHNSEEEDRDNMIPPIQSTLEEEKEEQRIDRSEVLCGNIEDHIDKFIHEMFPGFDQDSQRYDQLKNDIWGDICEHTEYE